MNIRLILLLIVAGLLALGATFVAKNLLLGHKTQSEVPIVKSNVYNIIVATSEIPYLSKINESDVKVHEMSEADLPGDKSLYLTKIEEAVGHIAGENIHIGIPLVHSAVREDPEGNHIATEVRPHFRAVTVRVDDVKGVGGFLLRGNLVDVYAASEDKEGSVKRSYYIAQAVRVLAVDQEPSQDPAKPIVARSVTLELPVQEAELLVKAQLVDTLQLLLRNPDDTEIISVTRPNTTKIVRIFKGSSKEAIQVIDCSGNTGCPGP
jgi:pilus assembly protein CpaB